MQPMYLVGKYERKRKHWRPRRRWVGTMKTGGKEMRCEIVDWMFLDQNTACFQNGKETSVYTKGGNLLPRRVTKISWSRILMNGIN
jgi:hypothetical protein